MTVETEFMIAEESVGPAEASPAVIIDDRATIDAARSVPLRSSAAMEAEETRTAAATSMLFRSSADELKNTLHSATGRTV